MAGLVSEIGPPLSNIPQKNLLFIARVGSVMYNLNVASSDSDYICIFASDTSEILSTLSCLHCRHSPIAARSNHGRYGARVTEQSGAQLRC